MRERWRWKKCWLAPPIEHPVIQAGRNLLTDSIPLRTHTQTKARQEAVHQQQQEEERPSSSSVLDREQARPPTSRRASTTTSDGGMASLAAAAASVTPDALQCLKERYPEEDGRILFAYLASKKNDVAGTVELYEVSQLS
jgi:hypothetical protein